MMLIAWILSSCIINYSLGRTVKVDLLIPGEYSSSNVVPEIAEYLALQSNDLLWTFTKGMCMHPDAVDSFITNNDHDSLAHLSLNSIAFQLRVQHGALSEALLRTSVSAGALTPAVGFSKSATSTFGNPCEGKAFAVIAPCGVIVCDAEQLVRAVAQNACKDSNADGSESGISEIIKHAHRYPAVSARQGFLKDDHLSTIVDLEVLLVGMIGTSSYCSLYEKMLVILQNKFSHKVAFLALPTDGVSSASAVTEASTTPVYGYGIYLDIKNMEYKTVDDREAAAKRSEGGGEEEDQGTSASSSEFTDAFVGGINFHTLAERFPDSVDRLRSLRDGLGDANSASATNSAKGIDSRCLDDASTMMRAAEQSLEPLKVWKMKDLGIQTVQATRSAFIRANSSARSPSPVERLMNVIYNFPSAVHCLSSVKVPRKLRTQVTDWWASGDFALQLRRLPFNSMYINGLAVPLDGYSFNTFDVLHVLQQESKLLSALRKTLTSHYTFRDDSAQADFMREIVDHSIALSSASGTTASVTTGGAVSQHQYQNPFLEGGSIRVDVSKGAKNIVHFVNNLEKDARYKRWSRSLRQLSMPSWNLLTIARNLYTVISVIDPLSPAGVNAVSQINGFISGGFPVRFGFVLSCADKEREDTTAWDKILGKGIGKTTAKRNMENMKKWKRANARTSDVCLIYAKLRMDYGTAEAWDFLTSLAAELEVQEVSGNQTTHSISLDKIADMYADAVAKSTQSWTTGSYKMDAMNLFVEPEDTAVEVHTTKKYRDLVTQTNNYVAARGLPVNSFSLNGIVHADGDLQNGLMRTIGREQFTMMQAYQHGFISDKTKSLFSAILETAQAYVRYHPILQQDQQQDSSTPAVGPVYVDLLQNDGSSTAMVPYFRTKRAKGLASPTVTNTVWGVVTPSATGYQSAAEILTWQLLSSPDENSICSQLDSSDDQRICRNCFERSDPDDAECAAYAKAKAKPPARVALFVRLNDTMEAHLKLIQLRVENSKALDIMDQLTQQERDVFLFYHLQDILIAPSQSNAIQQMHIRLMRQALTHLGLPDAFYAEQRGFTAEEKDLIQKEIGYSMQLDFQKEMERFHSDLPKEFVSQCYSLYNQVEELITKRSSSSSFINKEKIFSKAALDQVLSNHDIARKVFSSSEIVRSKPQLLDSTVSIMYNGRLFFSSSNNDVAGSKPLHHLDMQLYSLLEDRRLSDAMRASIQQLDAKSWKLPQEDLLLAASSFCGTHSAVSVMGSNKRHPIRKRIQEANLTLENTPFMIELGPRGEQNNDNEFHGLDIVYLLNPLSKAGQRSVGLMRLFENQLLLKQTAMLIPQTDLSDFPLQNYYRYVLPYHGSLARNDSVAVFEHLPTRHTFTIRTDVPEPWNVQSYKAHQDIDNLRCEGSYTCGDPIENDAGTTVCEVNEEEDGAATQCHTTPTYSDVTKATYLLKSIVLPGQCFEVLVEPYTGSEYHKPPSGLQIILRNELSGPDAIAKSTLVQSDTLVMNNYGYFQLQGNPGLWTLSLAPGRAASLYKIDPTMVFAHGDTLSVAVKSFRDSVTLVFVRKREGLEDIDLLDDAAAIYDVDPSASSPRRKLPSSSDNAGRNALWKSISTLWSKSQGDAKYFSGRSLDALKAGTAVDDAVAVANQTPEEEPEQLHVFSLATGKMYERLLRIMMLSVTKRTSMPVKFWLFENYLSPNFKKSAEIMSKKYGFEIGYVTYKWPAWLTQQSEKQRIIWGYKILFLDVLFPLSVKRIIYVDADQVVRADLKELWEMDLNGKPYGYVPFCSSRNETLGYQFWRSGFWSTHLQGLPYHISALYVVDLQNFRKRAVGDILRVTYDGLARDPNSLANLDQDLPNFAQHQVPIFSLPQEWLWCETWCDDASKENAKTIDLCNNPQHKEPKLDMARRIINGPPLFQESWTELDNEIYDLLAAKGL